MFLSLGPRIWKWLGSNEKQIKIVFSLIAAAYIIFEYRVKIEQDHIANSMAYVQRYTNEPILEVRDRLDAFWLSAQIQDFSRELQAVPDKAVRFKRYDKELPQKLKAVGRDRDVYKILLFYRDLGLCVRSGRCDSKTACDYFFLDMQSFRSNYWQLLGEWTTTLGERAPEELSQLVQQTCSANLIQYCKDHPSSPYCQKQKLESNQRTVNCLWGSP